MSWEITLHWTVGTYTPNHTDMRMYNYLIDGNGKVIEAIHPKEQENTSDGVYAAHAHLNNTRNIGISLCSMAG